ncbi:MAG TPA: aminotransferase class V-fold PLP-dependent enzyme [Fimbriimonadaceae bacterium]|jgi:kynureninase
MASAADKDYSDPLARFRDKFSIPDPDLIYLDGNSLGRMPLAAAGRLKEVSEAWAGDLVRSWSEWFGLPERLGAKIALLIGAQPDEVIVCDSTTINLFKLIYAALKLQSGRNVVVTDDLNFPSDVYAMSGVCQMFPLPCSREPDSFGGGSRGKPDRLSVRSAAPFCEAEGVRGRGQCSLDFIRSRDQVTVEFADLVSKLSEKVALLSLSHASFKSAFVYDMKSVTAEAHNCGISVLWDLSHSVGVLPIELNASEADFAIGCTYKYLNGGPGAPAFLYVRKDLQEKLESPIWGWFGQQNPFNFDLEYSPRRGMQKFLVGTPPILSLATAEPGIDIVLEAGIGNIRDKSILQTEYLIQLWREHLEPLGVQLKSPEISAMRGGHVSFGHPEALRIDKCLIERMNVVPDFRAPDNIRFGASPLYNTFAELEESVLRFKQIIENKLYEEYSDERPTVT